MHSVTLCHTPLQVTHGLELRQLLAVRGVLAAPPGVTTNTGADVDSPMPGVPTRQLDFTEGW